MHSDQEPTCVLLAHVPHCQLPSGAVGHPSLSKAKLIQVIGVSKAGSADRFQPTLRLQGAQLLCTATPPPVSQEGVSPPSTA